MNAISSPIHTGWCAATSAARLRPVVRAGAGAPVYCLHDLAGRPLGRIEAPVGRPELGRDARTLYLRRDH